MVRRQPPLRPRAPAAFAAVFGALLVAPVAEGRVRYWSDFKNTSTDTCSGRHCVISEGEVWVLDSSMEVETLTVQGMLKWDDTVDGLELRTGYLLVAEGGVFQVGTQRQPMELNALINITRRPVETHSHAEVGYRFVATSGADSRIDIHGRKLERTWTLLTKSAKSGDTKIFVKHDPGAEGMRWRPGDRIGIATTSRGNSSTNVIAAIGPAPEWPLAFKSVGKVHVADETVEQGGAAETLTSASAVAGGRKAGWGKFCKGLCLSSDRFFEFALVKPSHVSRVRLLFHQEKYPPTFTVEVKFAKSERWVHGAAMAHGSGGWHEVSIGKSVNGTAATAVRLNVDPHALASRSSNAEASAGVELKDAEVLGIEVDAPLVNAIHLREPLTRGHLGGVRTVGGRDFELAAEVVNLERSVVITGEDSTFNETHQGIHTAMVGKGTMSISHTRVEKCGQRNAVGRFCMHFLNGGQCLDCAFEGNAIVDSHQVGIGITNTHRTLVDSNVIWDARGAGIYVKDGNEMYNTISSNVVICARPGRCAVEWMGHRDSAGIYMVGMTNNVLENHVAGYENGIWAAGDRHPEGQGHAAKKVCPQFTPFGRFMGNVNHDCQVYGLRLGRQSPRNIERDSNGLLSDPGSCSNFTGDGVDNGVIPAQQIEDSYEYHNMYVGQFSSGDISFVRLTSVNNARSLLWKESKNFADGTSRHIVDSVFANDPTDAYGRLQVLGPAGPFAFLLENVTFLGGPTGRGTAALNAGFHCGRAGAGGPCAVQYFLHQVDFSGLQRTAKRIQFGASSMPMGKALPMFVSDDGSLDGKKSIVSRHLDGFAAEPGCQALDKYWDNGIACDAHIRRFRVRSKDLGPVRLSGPGYGQAAANMSEPVLGTNAGHMIYEDNDNTTALGYSLPVFLDRDYSVSGAWRGDVVFELSDPPLEYAFGAAERVGLSFAGQACTLRPQARRAETMFGTEICELRDTGEETALEQ